jgi:hypothetical protein
MPRRDGEVFRFGTAMQVSFEQRPALMAADHAKSFEKARL